MSFSRIACSLAIISSLAACANLAPERVVEQTASSTDRSASNALRNKQRALAFYGEFFNRHDLSAAERYIAPAYIQHNPRVANGRDAFVAAFTAIFARYPQRHSTIHAAIAEGDLVALHVHTVTDSNDIGMAIVDIFRFDNAGNIVEHWDVMQPVPATTASGNGMFK
ncbi:ester cyclase [Herbaspirillum sp. alder98]|uniref:nuclear transport factor 2 family protein n=1 Tax=Herbaspirillum sp. alder98 TaxID=2913096 RepID=UPI001CD82AD6|nr:ester cyclase [Herbaspirillum sp. alder98]MCA1323364.1 ester cyclase [Herbaspirillum sp. alder98]